MAEYLTVTAPMIFWDFDGTLAYRHASWSDCLLEVLDQNDPAHGFRIEQIRAVLSRGFPWHEHEKPHASPGDATEWWRLVGDLIRRGLIDMGCSAELADRSSSAFRSHYLTLDRWRLADDTVPVLTDLRDRGWSHVILSNHVPELNDIVDHLGLGRLITETVSSGVIGYEKPHPNAFQRALDIAGHPDPVWMAGDNPVADVAGAEKAGIPAILVRAQEFTMDYVERIEGSWARGGAWSDWQTHVKRRAADLTEAAGIIHRHSF